MPDDFQPVPTDWRRVLAVVAHPDDIEIAGAGAMALWAAEGKSVIYLLVSRGEAGIDSLSPGEAMVVREEEQLRSAALVGVEKVEFLNHRDGVIEYGLPLRREIASAIRRYRPDLVVAFNHHPQTSNGKANSPDHRNVGQAVIDAVGDAGNRWIFPELGVEPWGGVRYLLVANSPYPTHAVDITTTLDVAVASLEAHKTYLDGIGISDVRGPVEHYARAYGDRFGGCPAVAFELIPR